MAPAQNARSPSAELLSSAELLPSAEPNVGSDVWLLLGVFGGAIAWLLHLVLAYLVAEFGCVSSFRDVRWLGFSGVTWLEVAVSLFALALAIGSNRIANRIGGQFQGAVNDQQLEPHDPRVFLSRSGVLSSRLFILIIAVESLPILYYLREC